MPTLTQALRFNLKSPMKVSIANLHCKSPLQISFQSQISIENLFPIGNLHCKILAETSLKHPPTRGCNPLTPTRPAHSAKSSILTRLSHHFGSKKTEKLFRRGPWALLGRRPALFYAPWRLQKRQKVKNGILKTSAGL